MRSSIDSNTPGMYYVTGDATQPEAGVHPVIIVHIVNDIGAWGAGFVKALSKRNAAPENYYRRWHAGAPLTNGGEVRTGPLELGHVQVVTACIPPVANICAQRDIKSSLTSGAGRVRTSVPPIRYAALRQCLDRLEIILSDFDAGTNSRYTLHMPRIGAGLAGGDWRIISQIIADVFKHRCVVVYDLPGRR